MVKHIVMWDVTKTSNGKTIEENTLKFKEMLIALKGKIDLLKEIEVGINDINYEKNATICLMTTFDSYEDMAKYQVHPEHVKVGQFAKTITSSRYCVDYTVL